MQNFIYYMTPRSGFYYLFLSWFNVLSLIFSLSSSARADFYIHPFEDHYSSPHLLAIEPGLQFYSTKNNYSPSGSLISPSGLKNYTRLGFDFLTRYGINSRFSIFGRLSWLRNDISHDTLTGNIFGFGDQSFGASFRILEPHTNPFSKKATLDLQLQGDFPFYSNKKANDNNTPFLGDGSVDITGGAFLSFPLSKKPESSFLILGSGGLTWRTGGFSAALPWSLFVQYSHEESWSAKLGGVGFYSLKTDPNGVSGNTGSAGSGGGGSFIINTINPSLGALRGEISYHVDPHLGFTLALTQSLWGQAAPAGLNVFFGLSASFDLKKYSASEPSPSPKKLTPPEYGKSNQGFVDYAFEAKIMRISDRLNLLKIDKGSQEGVEVGQVFDIFSLKKDGNLGEVIARAECTHVKPNEAALKIIEYFKEIWIEEGFITKRPLQ